LPIKFEFLSLGFFILSNFSLNFKFKLQKIFALKILAFFQLFFPLKNYFISSQAVLIADADMRNIKAGKILCLSKIFCNSSQNEPKKISMTTF
jgi:hypothetical protein